MIMITTHIYAESILYLPSICCVAYLQLISTKRNGDSLGTRFFTTQHKSVSDVIHSVQISKNACVDVDITVPSGHRVLVCSLEHAVLNYTELSISVGAGTIYPYICTCLSRIYRPRSLAYNGAFILFLRLHAVATP